MLISPIVKQDLQTIKLSYYLSSVREYKAEYITFFIKLYWEIININRVATIFLHHKNK